MSNKKTKPVHLVLNPHAHESAAIYIEAILDACERCKVTNPLRVLTDADEFPRLQKIPEVEYAIGWLNGCAEAHGVTASVLWAHVRKQGVSSRLDRIAKRAS
jgi:hypothetical protein